MTPKLELLSAEAFEPFGQVVQPGRGDVKMIRGGSVELTRTPARLVHDERARELTLDFYATEGEGGTMRVEKAERHIHSAQLFVPLASARYLVVVWPGHPDEAAPRAFVGGAGQAVIYNPGTWHHGIVALDEKTTFASWMWRSGGPEDTEFMDLASPFALPLDKPVT